MLVYRTDWGSPKEIVLFHLIFPEIRNICNLCTLSPIALLLWIIRLNGKSFAMKYSSKQYWNLPNRLNILGNIEMLKWWKHVSLSILLRLIEKKMWGSNMLRYQAMYWKIRSYSSLLKFSRKRKIYLSSQQLAL